METLAGNTALDKTSSIRLPAARGCARATALEWGRSVFPREALARIFRPSRSVTTSGRARTRAWRLVFERRKAPFIEPLMGWTGGDDPLTEIELNFPTLDEAISYAERQGIAYVVMGGAKPEYRKQIEHDKRGEQAAQQVLWTYLWLDWLQTRYGVGTSPSADLERALADPAAIFASPAAVVTARGLTLQDKRNVLKRWAWDEYLTEISSGTSVPESGKPSVRDEVRSALLALEEQAHEKLLVSTAPEDAGARRTG